MSEKPVLSIITVVFNGVKELKKTIDSISCQSFKNFQWVVIDGGSTDGTMELIKAHESLVSGYISEKDQGLYDAMNKAFAMVTGDFIWFINAGDQIYDSSTLERVFSQGMDADVYYGQTLIVDSQYKELGLRRLKAPVTLNWRKLLSGMLVCHQSFIVRKSIAPLYNLSYHISSDYDWMIKCLKNAKGIINTELVLSKFLDGGLNKKKMKTGLKERFIIMCHHYGFFRTLLVHLYFPMRFVLFYIFHGRV